MQYNIGEPVGAGLVPARVESLHAIRQFHHVAGRDKPCPYRHQVIVMSIADDCRYDEENLLFTREELASDIDSILKGDAHSPEALAHMFILFGRAIAGGLEGINRVSNTLQAAIELIYPHSCAHAAGLRLYRLHVEGQLKVEDEPVRLINAVVERYTAGARAARGATGRNERPK